MPLLVRYYESVFCGWIKGSSCGFHSMWHGRILNYSRVLSGTGDIFRYRGLQYAVQSSESITRGYLPCRIYGCRVEELEHVSC